MTKLIDEFGAAGREFPSPRRCSASALPACCLALATAARWGLALIRPDVFFTPYFPAVFFATAFGGFRIGIATALVGRHARRQPSISAMRGRFRPIGAAADLSGRSAASPYGASSTTASIVAQQRRIAKRLIQEEEYRKLVVDELQHRLKNKMSTIHAVLHQVLQDQPQIWASIDHADTGAVGDRRSDRAGRRQRLRYQGSLALRTRALRPCPLYPERRSAVSSRQAGGEPCADLSRTGHQRRQIRRVFLPARAVAGVVVGVRTIASTSPGTKPKGRRSEAVGEAGFGTKLLKSALRAFDGKTEIAFLKTGIHCTMQCRIPAS